MIHVTDYSSANNSEVSARSSLSQRSLSTSRYTKNSSSPKSSIRVIRLFILCAAMLVSFVTGIIVHAVSGSDEVQAASLHSASLQVSSATSTESIDHTPATQKIIVLDGDTLWSIAENHAPKGHDIRAYIQKIKLKNQLSSSALQAGEVLVLP